MCTSSAIKKGKNEAQLLMLTIDQSPEELTALLSTTEHNWITAITLTAMRN